MNKEVLFSSKTDEWATPQEFFDTLDREFHFTLYPWEIEVWRLGKQRTVSLDGCNL